MLFRLVSNDTGPRRGPWTTGWRTVPFALLESPRGGTWILECEGGPTLRIASGGVLIVPGGLRHRLSVAPGDRLETVWAVVAFEHFPGCPVFRPEHGAFVLPAAAARTVRRLLLALDGLRGHDRLVDRARRQRCGYQALECILQHLEGDGVLAVPDDRQRLRPVLEYIERHPHEPLARHQLARMAHLSPTRFHYVFKETTGLAPMAYLQAVRLRRAQEWLIASNRSAKDIAARCGFASPIYFCRLFRKRHGVTPLTYRARWSQRA